MKKPRKNSKADLRKRTYSSWSNMLMRCYDASHVGYRQYGGRGIKVYSLWTPGHYTTLKVERQRMAAFRQFLKDVGNKPSAIHTLDRIDPNGNYIPSNVRWATPAEQNINKRDTHFVRHPKTGERISAALLATELKVRYQMLRASMIKRGTWYELTFVEEEEESANDDTE
jgi:hypothetical protein